jgi:hypothetical protein
MIAERDLFSVTLTAEGTVLALGRKIAVAVRFLFRRGDSTQGEDDECENEDRDDDICNDFHHSGISHDYKNDAPHKEGHDIRESELPGDGEEEFPFAVQFFEHRGHRSDAGGRKQNERHERKSSGGIEEVRQ